MYPIIFISKSLEDKDKFLQNFIQERKFKAIDIVTISPEKKELSIDQIRQLKRDIQTVPGNTRLIIIEGLDVSGHETQNALLKILEEQTEHNQFLFPVSSFGGVLPTIQSRCKLISAVKQSSTVRPETAHFIEKVLSSKNSSFLGDELATGISREDAITLLDELLRYFHKKLSEKSIPPSTLKQIIKTKSLLQNNNLNPQLTIDSTLLLIQRSFLK